MEFLALFTGEGRDEIGDGPCFLFVIKSKNKN